MCIFFFNFHFFLFHVFSLVKIERDVLRFSCSLQYQLSTFVIIGFREPNFK
ncbi:hypothetical protein M758_UG338100 [Ceratodon purpureus]|nr:hypothetical protein M758_UG338100 [Ceratodon purpureus]